MDLNAEDKLVSAMSRLVEQKVRTFSYEELSEMLRLTPLKDTISGQALVKNERLTILNAQIQLKFSLAESTMNTYIERLQLLSMEDLKALLREIIKFDTLEQLEVWLNEHLPTKELA